MVAGRQPLPGGAVTISVILTTGQRAELARRAGAMRRRLDRYVSVSEVVRNAVALYLTADSFFAREEVTSAQKK